MNGDLFAELLTEAHEDRCERSLPQLFPVFGLCDDLSTLERINNVALELKRWNLCLIPDSNQGEIESTRRVRFITQPQVSPPQVTLEISAGETERAEFKSSLVYDRKRAKNEPNAAIQTLTSEDVLHSCLKTVAAFLNSSGGILYLGTDDSGQIVGVEADFPCLSSNPDRHNIDQWQLYLRNRIESRFTDGKTVNDYIDVKSFYIEEKTLVRIEVASRRKISYLTVNQRPVLYRRQGNRTEEVLIDQMEEFLMSRGWKPPF
jgi:hypothetical protein